MVFFFFWTGLKIISISWLSSRRKYASVVEAPLGVKIIRAHVWQRAWIKTNMGTIKWQLPQLFTRIFHQPLFMSTSNDCAVIFLIHSILWNRWGPLHYPRIKAFLASDLKLSTVRQCKGRNGERLKHVNIAFLRKNHYIVKFHSKTMCC